MATGWAPALGPVLDALASWSDTRIANETKAIRPRIDACTAEISLVWPDGAEPEITCGALPVLRPLHEVWPDRPREELLFALPDRGQGRATGALTPLATGGFGVDARIPTPPPGSAWDLLVPSAEAPGPWRLNPAGALVHARVRQDRGVDIPALIGDRSQGQTLFNLQSDLFSSAVLDRTWELAIYPPGDGMGMPRMALAVGVRSAPLAKQAADQYLSTLAKQWTFQAEPWEEADHHGTCLRHLNLLPELEPCFTITPESLVISWNQASLSYGLSSSTGGAPPLPLSGMIVDFTGFPEADRKLTLAFNEGAGAEARYPWKSVALSAARADDEVLLHIDVATP